MISIFNGERLTLTQSDMDPSNFGIDATRRVVIFDIGEIGWLPEPFANHTLLRIGEFTLLKLLRACLATALVICLECH